MDCPLALGAAYRQSRMDSPGLTREEFCYRTRMKVMRRELVAYGVPFQAFSEHDILALRGKSEAGIETLRSKPAIIHPSHLQKKYISLIDLCDEPDGDEAQSSFDEELRQAIGIVHDIPFEDWRQFCRMQMTGWAFVRIARSRKDDREFVLVNTLDGKAICRANDKLDDIENHEPAIESADFFRARYDGRLLADIVDREVKRALESVNATKDERKRLRNCRRAVRTALSVLNGLDPREELIVARALEAMFRVGHVAAPIEHHLQAIEEEVAAKTAKMRAAKAQKNASWHDTLNDAIASICGTSPVDNPWSKATVIALKVNGFLHRKGLSPASIDQIYKKLKSRGAPHLPSDGP